MLLMWEKRVILKVKHNGEYKKQYFNNFADLNQHILLLGYLFADDITSEICTL